MYPLCYTPILWHTQIVTYPHIGTLKYPSHPHIGTPTYPAQHTSKHPQLVVDDVDSSTVAGVGDEITRSLRWMKVRSVRRVQHHDTRVGLIVSQAYMRDGL